MFLVWSGWGILAIPVAFAAIVVAAPVFKAVLAALGRPDLAFLGATATWLAAAAAVWWVGRFLNGQPGQEAVDPANGRTVLLRRRHSLFWVSMEYWAVPLVLMAVLALALALAGAPAAGS